MSTKPPREKIIRWILQDKYKNKSNPGIAKDLARIDSGKSLDYIIGWKPFLNCKIDLSFKPLIPRPETEFWTEQVITAIRERSPLPVKVLDIFSGSGCVGVAVLKNTKKTLVDFAEIDSRLARQISLNLKLNRISPRRYKVIKSDIFNKIKGKYDFILSNPPYIPTNRTSKVQRSVLKNEPHKALFSGTDGLEHIKKFLSRASEHLNANGQIWMEFGMGQKIAIEKIIRQKYHHWQFKKDQYGRWRFVIIFWE